MLTNIINGDAVVDVIAPSEYAIEKLLQHDLLEKIDKTKVSTISNVNSAIYEAVREVFGTFTHRRRGKPLTSRIISCRICGERSAYSTTPTS